MAGHWFQLLLLLLFMSHTCPCWSCITTPAHRIRGLVLSEEQAIELRKRRRHSLAWLDCRQLVIVFDFDLTSESEGLAWQQLATVKL